MVLDTNDIVTLDRNHIFPTLLFPPYEMGGGVYGKNKAQRYASVRFMAIADIQTSHLRLLIHLMCMLGIDSLVGSSPLLGLVNLRSFRLLG